MNECTRATWRTYVGGNSTILPGTIGRIEADGTKAATISELTVQKSNQISWLISSSRNPVLTISGSARTQVVKTVLIGRISCEFRSIVLTSLYIVLGG